MKLEWDEIDSEWQTAKTPFGIYWVKVNFEKTGWVWGYCFDDYYDEEEHECDGAEQGRMLANEHWQERIAPIIAPYKAREE